MLMAWQRKSFILAVTHLSYAFVCPRDNECYDVILKIRKSQDLAKDLGETASKAEKKICQSKIVSYIQKHNKTVIPKWKLIKRKEKKEEKKRREKGTARIRTPARRRTGRKFYH